MSADMALTRVTLTRREHQRGPLALRCLPPWVVFDAGNCRLVAPVSLGALGVGAGGNGGVVVVQSLFAGFWIVLVGPFHRPLRREPPAIEILSDGTSRHIGAKVLPNQSANGLHRPQRETQLQPIQAPIDDLTLKLLLLRRGQPSSGADRAPSRAFHPHFRPAARSARIRAEIVTPRNASLFRNDCVCAAAYGHANRSPPKSLRGFRRECSHVDSVHAPIH